MTRLARALNSSDLSHEPTDCDVDVLQATGSTAIYRNLGVLIIEAREGAAGEGAHAVARIKDLEQALEGHLKRIARRWRVRVNLQAVAAQVTKELVVDRCSVCQGRGTIPMKYDGQRMVAVNTEDDLSKDVDCVTCFGSGAARRDYYARAKSAGWKEYERLLGEWWEAVLQSCADAEAGARRSMWLKLKPSPSG
jgi:hypothetical protein